MKGVRVWLIVLTMLLGGFLIVAALVLDGRNDISGVWISVLIEVGVAFGLVGVLFIVERNFHRVVRKESEETVAKVADLVESINNTERPDELHINIVPTTTDRGREPKILVRIMDPEGGYQTSWRVELTDPRGYTRSQRANWPGSGYVYRARFPTTLPRTGVWSGVAIRNDKDRFEFKEMIS